jgi:hypothetical protein
MRGCSVASVAAGVSITAKIADASTRTVPPSRKYGRRRRHLAAKMSAPRNYRSRISRPCEHSVPHVSRLGNDPAVTCNDHAVVADQHWIDEPELGD